MESIAKRLRIAMDKIQISQSELSRRTGIGKSSISTYLSGDYEPKQRNIYKIAKALNVNESWLMGNDVTMDREVKKEEIPKEFAVMARKIGEIPEEHRKQLYRTLSRTIDSFLENDDEEDLEDF